VNSHPGVTETLELLERLQATIREFATREEKLVQELRTKSSLLERRRDEAIDSATRRLEEEVARADSCLEEGKTAAEATYKKQKSSISEKQKTGLKDGLKEIENKEGTRKHRLQTETLQSKRDRETGMANAETALAQFKTTLAADQEALGLLEATARKSFTGFGRFVRSLRRAPKEAEVDLSSDEYQLSSQLHELLDQAGNGLSRFRKRLLPAFFRYRLLWLGLIFAQLPLVLLEKQFGSTSFTYREAIASIVGCVVIGFVLHLFATRQAEPQARTIIANLGQARRLHDACFEKCEARYAKAIEGIENQFRAKSEGINQEWDRALEEAAADRASLPQRIKEETSRAFNENENVYRGQLQRLQREHADTIERVTLEAEARKKEASAMCAEKETKLQADYGELWRPLEAEWKSRIQPLYETIRTLQSEADRQFPPWEAQSLRNWKLPSQFGSAAKFARLEIDVAALCEGIPKDARLALPGPARFPLPVLLTYPQQGSVLFETTNSGRDEIIDTLNNIILRLLSNSPPGRLSFTIIDPVGLGQSFSGVMHLADYAEYLINSRIWTQTTQIEQRLAELNEHMEKVIQMYLRNEYATIAEYNEQAGNIAEKYHFVVVADFPAAFSDAAARRLLSIAASGARCGVFTLIHWDRRQPAPQDFVPEELKKSSVWIARAGNGFAFAEKSLPGTTLILDPPPATDLATEFIHKVGVLSRDSNRIEVPFAHVIPADAELWSLDTTSELRVPIGRTGATKLQYLAIGKGTRQHGLVAGKTGSGKSTLFHVIITNLALWSSPEQVEFYLIDFKKGVEFKCYAQNRLPHARVVAIESDREFGLSVLQRVDEELKHRGELFRKLGVQDIPGYKRAGGTEAIPRTLLMIDEFQEFFVEDDKIAQTASLLLDRIVRQGRAFGIHVLLGSQTLGGAYTVARTTLGQMVIRIALQCNEADAYLIMDDSNPAPRLLSRPGEGIYNDTAGTVEGNSPFQVVWLPDEERDAYLSKVRQLADAKPTAFPGPIVFEGNAPADVRENAELRRLLEADDVPSTASPRIWLGASNAIKGPTEAVFVRQSGNNLLVVGQREEAALAMVSIGLVALAAQYPRETARFILCDASPSGSPQREFLERIVGAIPYQITVAKQSDLPEIMKGLADELAQRTADAHESGTAPVFLLIHGLQKFNRLRYEEDFGFASGDAETASNPAVIFNHLICEGTRFGFHVIATCDTYNNVNRFLSRKALSEFEMRVLFQMSANDSASLVESPKANMLGLHRALFYNEQEGHLETFRPYALPPNEWIERAAQNLSRLLK
jgi:hypothetical protein